MRLRAWIPALLLWLLTFAPVLGAEHRFPPPDFESGHTFPNAEGQYPLPRAIWLQYLDVAVLAGALGAASYFALKKRSRRGLFWLSMFSLGYFGFYREGCVCAIGSIQNVTLALFNPGYTLPLTVTAFFVLPIATALFFGRSFCAAVCPHGAIQDLVLVRPVELPRWLEKGLGVLPFAALGLGVLFAATGSAFVICRYDPFIPIFRITGSLSGILLGAGFLLVGLFIGRPYCRFLCPYGALLRLASTVSRQQVSVTPDECKLCRICPEACPYGAIVGPTPAPEQGAIEASRRQFILACVLVPLLTISAGWVGSRFAAAAARLDARVSLAERFLAQKTGSAKETPSTVQQLELERGERTSVELLPEAVKVQDQFRRGGWILGAWIGVVIGVKLAAGSLWRRHQGYNPDSAACFECGRCFAFCPQEKRRLRSLVAAPACEVCGTTAPPAAASPTALGAPKASGQTG